MNDRSTKLLAISRRTPAVLLATSLIGAGAFAVFHSNAPPVEPVSVTTARAAGTADSPLPDPMRGTTLPPGHPAIGASNASLGMAASPTLASPSVRWTAPASWKLQPNVSSMRLATYRIPRAVGDTEDTDLSIVQAGGTTDANIERWLGQFDQAGKDLRTTSTVKGLEVTVVEVKGTYLAGGMMADSTPASHPGWALLAAIIATPTLPTFLKMVGPTKSVAAARPAFDALVASVSPTSTVAVK